MKWFGRQRKPGGEGQEPQQDGLQEVREMLDPYHHRASVEDGGRLIVQPGQVLENITVAMERLDIDINTPISIEDDVATQDELVGMIQTLGLGALLAAHVVNTAMRIMSARYPAELVRRPLPEQYDLRQLYPLTFTDREHETARKIFNERAARTVDLDADDLRSRMEPLATGQQVQVVLALFFMFGSKVGAMKHRTGIQ
ncbi:hypothetical protein FHG89_14235 [Micromonospora orduensis]|uniref:Uncharacterized protein n=1 Tax=Micromonospora orduensis TaxID=1420891 RepID=A0A5C4QSR4_9ACTN|nr:hypothetical protein [Micromonospora orduensis]TNH28793.1 hypothetical protein FHG89_14235 [Micromonospora orduensis]